MSARRRDGEVAQPQYWWCLLDTGSLKLKTTSVIKLLNFIWTLPKLESSLLHVCVFINMPCYICSSLFVVFLLSFCRRSHPTQWHVYHAQCFCQRDLTKQTSVEVFKVIPTFRSLKSPELRTQSWFGPSLLCSLLEGKHLKWAFWVLLSWIHLSQFMDTILVLQLGNFLAIAVGREYTTPLTKQTTSGTICILDFQTHFMNLNKFENGRKNFILKCWTFGKETFPIKCF